MGKKSIKENKNIYQTTREGLDLTREKASDLLNIISADRIEKIESGKSLPHPDEVLLMSECYKQPSLCNYYCSHECPIGQVYVPEIKEKELPQIVLEMLATLNAINKDKERLIEITADGEITADEIKDFKAIQEKLEQISIASDALQLWIKKAVFDGKVSE
ncbi:MAG: helix-turn-helix transcriptional regulator [Clostridia bacterium]|nr:helix-turn-helix transcriptional regulator [Clostridia bacterium]